jgi:hypothetical protein
LSACGQTKEIPKVETVTVTVPVGLTARIDRPVIPDNPTQRSVGVLLTDYDAALSTCNARLDEIRGLK